MLTATRNQLSVAKNVDQGPSLRLLFVCSAGVLRSPTGAHVFSSPPYNYNTRSAGSSIAYALVPVDEALLAWADYVFVMEYSNYKEMQGNLGKELFEDYSDKVYILNVPDNFGYRDPELVTLLTREVNRRLKNLGG